MNFSDLWYDAFRVDSPTLHYKIEVALQKYVPVVEKTGTEKRVVGRQWKSISKFILSPSSPGGRTKDGTVSLYPQLCSKY